MVGQREVSRSEARVRRALHKSSAERKAKSSRELANAALVRVRSVLGDPAFIDLLREQRIYSLPKRLVAVEPPVDLNQLETDCTLDFVVAWKFFYPLFNEPSAAERMEAHWPGLIVQIKDAFIALVVDGPFPA